MGAAAPAPPCKLIPPRNWSAAVQLGSNIAAAVPGLAGCPTAGHVGSLFPVSPAATLTGVTGPAIVEISLNVGARHEVPAGPRNVRHAPTSQLNATLGFLVDPSLV